MDSPVSLIAHNYDLTAGKYYGKILFSSLLVRVLILECIMQSSKTFKER